MAFIFVKNTGSDAADGSYETPKASIAGAMAIHTQRDTIALLSDIQLSAKVNMAIYAAYLVNSIIGVNDAGVEDGTRRRIYGNGTCDYAFHFSANSYTWSWRNIDFDTFTEYVISNTFTYSYKSGMSNFSISNCKGLTNGVLFGFGSGGIFEDFEVYNCSGGGHCFATQIGLLKNGIFKNNTAVQYIVSGANAGCYCENIIIENCQTSQTNLRIINTLLGAENLIIDRCAVATGATSSLLYCNGHLRNILLTNNSVGAGANLLVYATGVSQIYNMAIYNCTHTGAQIAKLSGDALTRNILTLTETPYQTDDGIDFTLKPSFEWRRKRFELGKFVGVLAPTGL